MSKLVNARGNWKKVRWQLLTTVSAAALVTSVCCMGEALAADDSGDRPVLWIELGGQLSRWIADRNYSILHFSPGALRYSNLPNNSTPPLYGFDEDGKLSFQPENTDWIFSASIRYGRSASNRNFHQQTYPGTYFKYTANGGIGGQNKPAAAKFADTSARTSEKHLLLNFRPERMSGSACSVLTARPS